MRLKLTILLLGLVAAVAGLTAPAGAQYGGNQGFLIDPSVVFPGDEVNFLGTGCPAGSTVTFAIPDLGLELGTTTADNSDEGNFFLGNVVIPEGTPPGTYTVTATCGDTVLTATLVVQEVPVTTPGPALAVTGSNRSTPLAQIAIVLVALGGAILLATGKRRERGSTDS